MKQIARSALVPFSADKMFHLVNDISCYPDFLPGCSSSRILESTPDRVIASMEISKIGISRTFTTNNELIPGKAILMSLVEGPFRFLNGGWYFTPLDNYACRTELKLSFDFSNQMIEIVFGKIFKELTDSMVGAFTRRAEQIYAEK